MSLVHVLDKKLNLYFIIMCELTYWTSSSNIPVQPGHNYTLHSANCELFPEFLSDSSLKDSWTVVNKPHLAPLDFTTVLI